ncbi:unnamed protein product [Absidia cylindrospora]
MSQPGKKKRSRMKMDLGIFCAASNNDSEHEDVASLSGVLIGVNFRALYRQIGLGRSGWFGGKNDCLIILKMHGLLGAEWMKVMMDKLSLFRQLSLNIKDHCELVGTSKYQHKTTLARFTRFDKDPPTYHTHQIWTPSGSSLQPQ